MGLYGNISKALDKKAMDIFKASTSNICSAQVKLYSDKNTDISVKPMAIKNCSICAVPEKNYHETITATFDVSLEEALLLTANSTDLRATIIFNHVTQHYYRTIPEIPPEIRKFRVIITNQDEIRKDRQKVEYASSSGETSGKQYTPNDVRSARQDLRVEMMLDYPALKDGNLFTARNRPLNGIAKNATMDSIIHFVANSLGIKKVNMVKPDNTNPYKHVFLPPMKDLSSILSGMQETHGIYQKGLNYFISEDTLNVYPAFDTNPKSVSGELHLYRLPKGAYPGCSSYHCVGEDGNIHIVLTEESTMTNTAPVGVETVGNYQAATRSDTYLDTDAIAKGKEIEIRKNNMLTVGAENARAASDGRVVAKYNNNTNNPLKMSSEMAGALCIVMQTVWPMAWPWLIKPNTKVIYHYEEMGGLKTTTGIVAGTEYSLSPIAGALGDYLFYAWKAVISCRLSQDAQKEEAVTPSSLPSMAGLLKMVTGK